MVDPPGETSAAIEVGDLEIEVCGLQAELAAVGLDQHVRQNGNGIAPLDHAMHVTQRPQKFCTLDCNFHRKIRFGALENTPEPGATAGRRNAECEAGGQR